VLKRLQKIESATARFAYGRYKNDIGDILKVNWLQLKKEEILICLS